ncbi:MAG: hypothetical protein ABIB43_04825 [archaeon]
MNKEKKNSWFSSGEKLFLSTLAVSFTILTYGLYKTYSPPLVRKFQKLEQKLNYSITVPYNNLETYLSEQVKIDLSYVDSLKHEKQKLETNEAYISENNIYQNEKKKGAIIGWIGGGTLWLQLLSVTIYDARREKKRKKSEKKLTNQPE